MTSECHQDMLTRFIDVVLRYCGTAKNDVVILLTLVSVDGGNFFSVMSTRNYLVSLILGVIMS